MLDKIRENKLFVGISLLVILFIAVGSFWLVKNQKTAISNKANTMDSAYLIPNVPYYGIYDHFAKYINSNTNSVFSVVEYWSPGLVETLETKNDNLNVEKISDIVNVFGKENFTIQSLRLSLPELKKYINSEVKTPLLLSLPIAVNQPDTITYYPMTVLIGINEKEQKLTFHNYWLGNNYELSYAEFNQLENRMPADQRNSYIVIQPNNLNEKLEEIAQRKVQAYPARISIMQNGEGMFKNYAIGLAAYNLKINSIAREYLSKVETDAGYAEYLPPFFKAWTADIIGQAYYDDGDFDSALPYAQRAVAEDHSLDQPFGDWPGIRIDWNSGDETRFANAYNLLGDIYLQKKDFQKAREAYVEALNIMPNSAALKNNIAIIDALEK